MSTRHDRLFKELLTLFLYEFLELFVPDLAKLVDPATIEFFDKEMFTELGLGDRREADLVARATMAAEPVFFLIHVEHQAQHVEKFERRMFRYWATLYERYNLPVYPVAVFSYSTVKRIMAEEHRVAFPEFTPLIFQFRTIHLKRLDWRDYALRVNPVAAALMARMKIPRRDRPRVKLACLRLLANLNLDKARSFYVAHFVEQYLRLNPQEHQEFAAEIETIAAGEREAVMKVTNSWFEQGLEQGLEQGRERGLHEGRQQGARASIVALLERRFGLLDQGLVNRLDGVMNHQLLLEMTLAAAEVASLDEFRQRLSAAIPD